MHILFWLTPMLFAVFAAVLPELFLLPGRAWLSVVEGKGPADVLIALIGILPVALILLIMAGNRLRMAKAITDSQQYARIQKMGILGRFLARDVIERIQLQARLGRKRRLKSWFSTRFIGAAALFGHSTVSLIRLSPGAMIRLFVSGGVLVLSVTFILSLGGSPSLPLFMLLYIVLLQQRPSGLVRGLRAHSDQPFMRQLIPSSSLKLVLASTALPFAITASGMLAVVLAQPLIDPLVGAVLSVSCLITMTLCLALELVRLRHALFPRITYGYSTLAVGSLVILGGYLSGSLWGAAVTSALMNFLLVRVLAGAYVR
ncbi:MAG: hypothetical protein IPK19_14420 [Chloroflexi bacterium]|nr:hypothetical protein [Chloroflexota bacterium]